MRTVYPCLTSIPGFIIYILPDFWAFVDCSFSITLHINTFYTNKNTERRTVLC